MNAATRSAKVGKWVRIAAFVLALLIYVIIGVATLLLLKIAAAIEWLAQPGKGSAVNGPETGFTEMTAGVKIGTGHNAYALPFSGSTIKCKVSPRTSSSLGLHDALVVYMRATNGELYPQHQLTES